MASERHGASVHLTPHETISVPMKHIRPPWNRCCSHETKSAPIEQIPLPWTWTISPKKPYYTSKISFLISEDFFLLGNSINSSIKHSPPQWNCIPPWKRIKSTHKTLSYCLAFQNSPMKKILLPWNWFRPREADRFFRVFLLVRIIIGLKVSALDRIYCISYH